MAETVMVDVEQRWNDFLGAGLYPLAAPEPGAQQRHSGWLLPTGQDLDPAGWERLAVRHLALPPMEEGR